MQTSGAMRREKAKSYLVVRIWNERARDALLILPWRGRVDARETRGGVG